MKLGRVVIPIIATAAVVALGVVAVALVANGVLASEPTSEPTSEPPATPTPLPVSSDTTSPDAKPAPPLTTEIELKLPEFPKKTEGETVQVERSKPAARSAPPPQTQGKTYTWEDGDRTLSVVLQGDLVVQKTSEITTEDVVVVKGAGSSIVRRQSTHGANAGPVFKSESGGGLMTLPGGVLLALDPDWDETQVEEFFAANGISSDKVSEMEFIENAFLVETESGFPSLELANDLAGQDGVLISSPNWSREVETR